MHAGSISTDGVGEYICSFVISAISRITVVGINAGTVIGIVLCDERCADHAAWQRIDAAAILCGVGCNDAVAHMTVLRNQHSSTQSLVAVALIGVTIGDVASVNHS